MLVPQLPQPAVVPVLVPPTVPVPQPQPALQLPHPTVVTPPTEPQLQPLFTPPMKPHSPSPQGGKNEATGN